MPKRSVHGLNLAVPEDAKAIIKPWNERDDTSKFADSGVDDQVCYIMRDSQFLLRLPVRSLYTFRLPRMCAYGLSS